MGKAVTEKLKKSCCKSGNTFKTFSSKDIINNEQTSETLEYDYVTPLISKKLHDRNPYETFW